MKHVLSLAIGAITALCFVAFVAVVKPRPIAAVAGTRNVDLCCKDGSVPPRCSYTSIDPCPAKSWSLGDDCSDPRNEIDGCASAHGRTGNH
jgi:hypothetical protein